MDIIIALSAGFLSFVSPCVLPLIPSFLAILAGLSIKEMQNQAHSKTRMFLRSLSFVIGMIIPLVILGMSASYLGGLLQSYQMLLSQLLGFVVILFGLHLLGLLNISLLNRQFRLDFMFEGKKSMWSLLLMGLAFGFGWTPCIGPMLSTILIMASTTETMWQGGFLLFVYGLGLGVPFLLLGLLSAYSMRFFNWMKRYMKVISIVSGVLLIALGLLLVTGNMAYIIPVLP